MLLNYCNVSILECGLFGSTQLNPLIVHGQVAKENSAFSWHAAILKRETKNGQFKYACGASLIERNVLLSAAHCITDPIEGKLLPFKDFQVVLNPLSDELSGEFVYDDETLIFNVRISIINFIHYCQYYCVNFKNQLRF